MSYAFDWDALERVNAKAMSGISAIKLKAIAMKFRHKSVGYKFTREGSARARRASAMNALTQPLQKSSPEHPGKENSFKKASAVIDVVGADNMLGLQAIFVHPFCIPLVCVPLGIMSPMLGWSDVLTFWLNFLALVPLAKILGDATEELAACLQNDTLSGLLNATFGNAVEMIVSIQSIRAGLFNVVKASLLGSVLSNILLVLGSAFFLGGLTRNKAKCGPYHSFKSQGDRWKKRAIGLEKEQKFPVKSALISLGMLMFACMVVVLPTLFNALPSGDTKAVLKVSRIGSWITMSSYIMYLIFQLLTHSVTLANEEKMMPSQSAPPPRRRGMANEDVLQDSAESEEDDDDDDDEEGDPSLDAWVAVALMAFSTVIVAINSEFLVGSIQNVVRGSGIPIGFIGVILLPIAGNACEHASALRFSMRDRPGLAIGIAVGSSTQVALLVIPFSVLVAQAMGQPLDLDFGLLNVAVVTFSTLVVFILVLDGRSNWFKGYILIAMYVFIAALYLYIPPTFGDSRLGRIG